MNIYGTNRVIEKEAETRRGGIKAKQNLLQKLFIFSFTDDSKDIIFTYEEKIISINM